MPGLGADRQQQGRHVPHSGHYGLSDGRRNMEACTSGAKLHDQAGHVHAIVVLHNRVDCLHGLAACKAALCASGSSSSSPLLLQQLCDVGEGQLQRALHLLVGPVAHVPHGPLVGDGRGDHLVDGQLRGAGAQPCVSKCCAAESSVTKRRLQAASARASVHGSPYAAVRHSTNCDTPTSVLCCAEHRAQPRSADDIVHPEQPCLAQQHPLHCAAVCT
jgi:hypothetical protein